MEKEKENKSAKKHLKITLAKTMMFISKYVYWLEQLFNESLGKISAFIFASDCHHIFSFFSFW